jgi:hypothetical protein
MSTPLFQEALIEAKKLREAATIEAKNAVMESISPVIKQMIDREINVILEQEEPADMPPPAPPAPSPDAGAAAPIEPAGGPEADMAAPMPPAAVAAAAPPIASPNAQVLGTITTGPDGGQRITIPIDQLFQPEVKPAAAGTEMAPVPAEAAEPTTPQPVQAPAPGPAEMSAPTEEMPKSLAEIYSAVSKLIAEQAAPAPAPAVDPNAPPAPPPAVDPNAPAPAAPAPVPVPAVDPNAPPPAPVPAVEPNAPPAPMAMPPAAPVPVPAAQPAPIAPAPNAAAPVVDPNAPPAPIQEYKNYKQKFEKLEEAVTGLRKTNKTNKNFIKESCEKEIYSLYTTLINLKENNAISPRLFSFNEERLELLHENLNLIYSYTKIPLLKGNNMQTKRKDSLKEFAKSLFEGAEGFEKSVGHVDPEGDAEGGDAEHAHKLSGNPHHVKAEAEKAKFPTKQKNEWPGKPSAESLLEQLEEEIAEFMSEDDDNQMEEEVVLELDANEVVAEAARSRKRLRALREQAEAEAEDDSLTLDIDLDGAGAEDINVNVNVNGEPVTGEEDEDMEGMEGMEDGEEDAGEDMEDMEDMEDGEEEAAALQEVRKLVRKELRLLESKDSEEDVKEDSEEDVKESVNENKALRGQLQETQLLTARSLYLNKIFVRDDLSGTQKRKIVEYLDSARTISEAKEVYNRIVKVLNTAKKSGMMNESVDGRRNLNEGRNEPGFDTTRWQILAGVKKS